MIKYLIVLLSTITCILGWDYHNFDSWGDVASTCTAGQSQSPIDVCASGQPISGIPIQFSNYDSLLQPLKVQNNGHTVQLNGNSNGAQPSITGSLLSNEVYTFSNAHLHWGTNNNNGTEHAWNGQKYAVELHLVHFNSKYQNISAAVNQPDGLAVFGVPFSVNSAAQPNSGMVQYSQLAQTVSSLKSSSTSDSFDLSSLLPSPLQAIYSYSGSLTTPPCAETVRWIVAASPLPIDSSIVAAFRNVTLAHNDKQNFRPLQSVNNRPIQYYTN